MNNTASFLTLIFIAILMVGMLLVLIIVFVNKKNAIIEKKRRDEEDYHKRITSSELQALRSQMNPHFIHNSLNSILYYIQQNDVKSSERYLNKFSNLIRMFFELSRKKEIRLSEEIELLDHYLTIEKLRFEDKLNFQIKANSGLIPEKVLLPSMILQPIVENAVNHGIFHKTAPGNIEISFSQNEKGDILVRIQDDGIGVSNSLALKTKDSSAKAHSTDVLRDRLALLHDSKEFDIQMSQTDLFPEGSNKGTLVNLVIHKNK